MTTGAPSRPERWQAGAPRRARARPCRPAKIYQFWQFRPGIFSKDLLLAMAAQRDRVNTAVLSRRRLPYLVVPFSRERPESGVLGPFFMGFRRQRRQWVAFRCLEQP